jgi:hypothetical protein
MELRVLLRALTERMPGIRLAGEPVRLRSNFVNGIKHMPVRSTEGNLGPPRRVAGLVAIRAGCYG